VPVRHFTQRFIGILGMHSDIPIETLQLRR
jgi:hypothetical protein